MTAPSKPRPALPVAEGPVGAVDTARVEVLREEAAAPSRGVELLSERGCSLWHADWRQLTEVARERGGVDAVIVDAPYSEQTHAGHDGADRNDGSGVIAARGDHAYGHREKTRGINYAPWSADGVREFVEEWAPLTSGWIVSITDDVLAPVWRDAMEAAGRYAFAPLPLVSVGSTVRLVGDGPSSWTCWIVVSRPSDGAWLKTWRADRKARALPRALRGAYVYTGHGDRRVMGGKTSAAMLDLVRDYTRPGDLVCDPCMGAGTTGLACLLEGRRFLGGDMMREHADLAVERLRAMPAETRTGQLALLGAGR